MTVAKAISASLYVCEYFFVRGIAVLPSGVNAVLLQRVKTVSCHGLTKTDVDPNPVIWIAPCRETRDLRFTAQ